METFATPFMSLRKCLRRYSSCPKEFVIELRALGPGEPRRLLQAYAYLFYGWRLFNNKLYQPQIFQQSSIIISFKINKRREQIAACVERERERERERNRVWDEERVQREEKMRRSCAASTVLTGEENSCPLFSVCWPSTDRTAHGARSPGTSPSISPSTTSVP
jgi:hypothetical protein